MSTASYRLPPGDATAIVETGGPTTLPVGAIADGKILKRVGSEIVGVNEACCFPPDRTMIVSKTIPAGADPLRWFTDINSAIVAALNFAWPSGPVTNEDHAHVWVAQGDPYAEDVILASGVTVTAMPGPDSSEHDGGPTHLIEVNSFSYSPGAGINAPQAGVDERVKVVGFNAMNGGGTALTVNAAAKPPGTTAVIEYWGDVSELTRVDGAAPGDGALKVLLQGVFSGLDVRSAAENVGVRLGPGSFTSVIAARGPVSVFAPHCNILGIFADPFSGVATDFADGPSIFAEWSRFNDTAITANGGSDIRVEHAKGISAITASGRGPTRVATVVADHAEISQSVIALAVAGQPAPAADIKARWAQIGGDVFARGLVVGEPEPLAPVIDISWSRVQGIIEAGQTDGVGQIIARHAEIEQTARIIDNGQIDLHEAVVFGTVTNDTIAGGSGDINLDQAVVGRPSAPADVVCNGGTISARGATCHGLVHQTGDGVVTWNAGNAGALTNDGLAGMVALGTTVIGAVTNTGDGDITIESGRAASIVNTGTGFIFARGTKISTTNNVATGTGEVRRWQMGVTPPLNGAGPFPITIVGAPYDAGASFNVLLQQQVSVPGPTVPVPAAVTAKTPGPIGAFTITLAAPGIGEVFAYEIIPT